MMAGVSLTFTCKHLMNKLLFTATCVLIGLITGHAHAQPAPLAAQSLPADAQCAKPPSGDPLAAYKDTKFLSYITGRALKLTPIAGLFAYDSAKGDLTWYLDTRTNTAATREATHRFDQVKGKFSRLTTKQDETYRQSLVPRLCLDAKSRWTLGDGNPKGKRELVLVTAHDCPSCTTLLQSLDVQKSKLNVTINFMFGVIGDITDKSTQRDLLNIICAPDPIVAYRAAAKEKPVKSAQCSANPEAFEYATSMLNVSYFPYMFDRATGAVIDVSSDDDLAQVLNAK
jgi:hypothetical protein